MFSYDQALSDSIKYFDGDDLSARVFLDKYALRDSEGNILENTPEMMHRRMAKEFARIESKKFKDPLKEQEIFDLFDKFKYIVPQGSPMFGIGNNHQIVSLSNCYVLSQPHDSYSSILQVDEELVNISKRRGGVGIDLTNLRPAGTVTRNAAKTSTGIVSWMERYSNSIREVGQQARRGALMLTLSVHHPDILAFSTIKNDNTKVTGANISVRLSQEFLDALNNNTDYELRWPEENPTIRKMVSAKEVWDTIIHSAWLRAEPGILMWDNIKNGPAECYEEYRSVSTNPCAEISLSSHDSCRLIALNLLSYVDQPFTNSAKFNFELFYNHTQIAQRLMDNLVDLESEKIDQIINKIVNDPEPEHIKRNELDLWKKIKRFNNEGRRTGLGITALGDTLAALNIVYGSEDSIGMTEEIYKCLKLGAYRSSVDMAKELGSFKAWNTKNETNCEFINRIREDKIFMLKKPNKDVSNSDEITIQVTYIDGNEIYNDMQKYGRRNIALLTTAPTGSVSIMTQTTSGIEPLFMIGYTRRKKINPGDKNTKVDFVDQNGDSWEEFTVYHPTVKKWMAITGETDVSKSPWYGCCAEDINWINRVKMQVAAQKHVCHAISSTLNLPEDVKEEEISRIYIEAFTAGCKGVTVYRKNCRSGVLVDSSAKTESIKKTTAPKRPQDLPCDVHTVSIKGKPYVVFVGLLNGEPYEVFAGLNTTAHVPSEISSGIIRKTVRPKGYKFVGADFEIFPIGVLMDDFEEALTRMISTSLRHGADIPFVVQQLQKTHGDLTSFAKAISRTLKKYIKDGTSAGKCSCGATMIFEEGCSKCMSCGNSKCG